MTLIQEIIGAFTGQNRRDKNKEVVLGVLGGLTVGVIGALLLAPKSGKETRQDIKAVSYTHLTLPTTERV